MAEDIRTRIADLIQKNNVLLFMKGTRHLPACGFSNTVVEILKKEGVSFETFNILADPDMRQAMQSPRDPAEPSREEQHSHGERDFDREPEGAPEDVPRGNEGDGREDNER
jgi:hypothetical protein